MIWYMAKWNHTWKLVQNSGKLKYEDTVAQLHTSRCLGKPKEQVTQLQKSHKAWENQKSRWHNFKQVTRLGKTKRAGDTTSKKSQGLGKPQPQPSHPNLRVIFVWESVLKKFLILINLPIPFGSRYHWTVGPFKKQDSQQRKKAPLRIAPRLVRICHPSGMGSQIYARNQPTRPFCMPSISGNQLWMCLNCWSEEKSTI